MVIVTIARQVGSGGNTIATTLATRLGYPLYSRHELRLEALKSSLSLPQSFEDFAREESYAPIETPLISRLHISYGELEFDDAIGGRAGNPTVETEPSFLDALTVQRSDILLALQSVVYRLASAGRAVFVGAGTQMLLAETPGILRVKIVASEAIRAERLANAYGLESRDAVAAIRHADREQRDYNQAIFGVDWEEVLLWDLILNTDQLSVEDASGWLAAFVVQPPFADRPEPGSTAALEAAAAINYGIWSFTTLRAAGISAVPVRDAVALRGTAPSTAVHNHMIEVCARTAPSTQIHDEIVIDETRESTS